MQTVTVGTGQRAHGVLKLKQLRMWSWEHCLQRLFIALCGAVCRSTGTRARRVSFYRYTCTPCVVLQVHVHAVCRSAGTRARRVSFCRYTCTPCVVLQVHVHAVCRSTGTRARRVSFYRYTCTPCVVLQVHVHAVCRSAGTRARRVSFYRYTCTPCVVLQVHVHAVCRSQLVHSSLIHSLHSPDSSFPVVLEHLHFLLLFLC